MSENQTHSSEQEDFDIESLGDPNNRLLILDVPLKTYSEDIQTLFEKFGEVCGIKIVRSKQSAYVQFKVPVPKLLLYWFLKLKQMPDIR